MSPRIRAVMVCVAVLLLASCTAQAPIEEVDPPGDRDDLGAGESQPVTDSMYPDFGNEDIDVLHYGLTLDYKPDSRQLSGSANLTIRPVNDASELALDFSDAMTIDRVTVDESSADFELDDWDLVIDTKVRADQEINVNVTYRGTPQLVPAPAQRDDMTEGLGASTDNSGALWSFQEPYGALTWYPVNDHPSDEALYDFSITVPDGYSGVASGTFEGQDGNTFHWSSSDPVASYLTTIAVDEFELLEMTGPGDLPITAWIPPEYDSMRPVAERMPEMVEYLEERYGPYPFESAGVVVVGGQSAMETQQMITFSGVMGDFGAESVMVHELAHQWFGNAVTPRDWSALWINEGPATYIEQMWNVDEGLTDADEVVDEWQTQDGLARAESGPPGDADPLGFANSNSYVCPALMLYELRDELGGRDEVDAYLEAWVRENGNQNVDRDDFIAFANEYADADLTEFFDEWLDSPTTPK